MPGLGLPLVDKDDILSPLPAAINVRDGDQRSRLSRGADEVLQVLRRNSSGAVLSSFWRRSELSSTPGTPTDCLASLSGVVVEVVCRCSVETAVAWFAGRVRHEGHGEDTKSKEELSTQFTALADLGALGSGQAIIEVDTTADLDVSVLAAEIRRAARRDM